MTVAGSDLRATLRARRRALPEAEQRAAARAVLRHLEPWIEATTPGTAGAYVATDGEISPALIVERLRLAGWDIAYPRIEGDKMWFHLVAHETDLVEGPWQLLEPDASLPVVAPDALDMVLMPLVGFDDRCNRMGRGKAFYDRAFAFRLDDPSAVRPRLIGLAHTAQRVAALHQADHDVSLDAVVTPPEVFGSMYAPSPQ